MPVLEFLNVNLNVTARVPVSGAGGAGDSSGNRTLKFRVGDYDTYSVQAVLRTGTWATATVSARKGNCEDLSATQAYATPVTLSAAAPMSAAVTVDSEWAFVYVTAAEGSDNQVDFYVHLHRAVIQ